MASLGQKFLKERERQKLSLDEVANATKISARMLKAIEEEHFDRLPGGVFNKGFIRAYAKHLGIDSEEAVNEYLAWLRQAQIDASTPQSVAHAPGARIPAPKAVAGAKPGADEELPGLQLPKAEHVRPMRRRGIDAEGGVPWGLVAVAVLVIAGGVVVWNRRSHDARAGVAASVPVQASPTVPYVAAASPAVGSSKGTGVRSVAVKSGVLSAQGSTPRAAASQTSAVQNPQTIARAEHPVRSAKPGIETSGQASSQTAGAGSSSTQKTIAIIAAGVAQDQNPAAQANEQPSAAQTVPMQTASSQASRPEGATASSEETEPAAPASPEARLNLVIRASENSWISVSADGKTVTQETLIAPAHTSIRASREIVVKAGNAAGVSFLLNGKEIPAQGAEAEVKTFVFGSSGLQSNAQE